MRPSYIDPRVSGVIRYSCALLFILFSSCYLLFLQGNLLAEAQFVFSRGLTTYSIFVGAFTITAGLQIIQWVVVRIIHFNWQYYSFSYLPSLLLLAMLTNITRSDLYDFSLGHWWWLLPLILVVFFGVVYLFKDRFATSNSTRYLLWRNYLILFILILLCGAIPRTHEVDHYELTAENCIMEQDYEEATKIAEKSLHTSRRLTELRMFALSQQGLLAERLFDYPQNYRGDGLLKISDNDSIYRYSPLRICFRLGALPKTNQNPTTLKYLWAVNSVDSLRTPVTQDYLLCYLLLQKKLKSFEKKLQEFYPVETDSILPRAYKEAVVYINNVYGENLKYVIDEDTQNRFEQYKNRKTEISNPVARRNLIRRDFGNTFWWYYENK